MIIFMCPVSGSVFNKKKLVIWKKIKSFKKNEKNLNVRFTDFLKPSLPYGT